MATWIDKGNRSRQSVQAATESAPTTMEEGVNLDSVSGFTVHFSCDSGQTFSSTAGGFSAYVWNEFALAWSRTPELDIAVPTNAVGLRRFSSTGWNVASPRARVAHVASGIGISGGSVTVDYTCSLLRGDQA
jgi:hypothetical protein